MSPLFRRARQEEAPPASMERPEVRQYRYLLSSAPASTLDSLHREALSTLDPLVRAQVLGTVQERLLTGRDLTVDDVDQVARLLTMAEVRTGGIIVSALTEMALTRVAGAVVRLPGAEELLTGCEDWDGVDADPRESAHRLSPQPVTKLA